jgi:hypothetical protein
VLKRQAKIPTLVALNELLTKANFITKPITKKRYVRLRYGDKSSRSFKISKKFDKLSPTLQVIQICRVIQFGGSKC